MDIYHNKSNRLQLKLNRYLPHIIKNTSILCIIAGLLTVNGLSKQTEKKLKDGWKELIGCQLSEAQGNDGDSFHVTHMGKEYVFRLYLVDCPETDLSQIERNVEQMKEFDAPLEKLLATGKLAGEVTKKVLSKPFTVLTKGEDAMGRSQLGRSYAFIETSSGSDLAEILLDHGLARSYGKNTEAPSIRADIRSKYDRIAQRAQRSKIGAWGDKNIKLPNQALVTNGDILRAEREAKDIQRKKQQDVEDITTYLGGDKNPSKPKKTEPTSDPTPNKMEPLIRKPQEKVIQRHDSIFYETQGKGETEEANYQEKDVMPSIEMDTSLFENN